METFFRDMLCLDYEKKVSNLEELQVVTTEAFVRNWPFVMDHSIGGKMNRNETNIRKRTLELRDTKLDLEIL